jgi:hypothetical protein
VVKKATERTRAKAAAGARGKQEHERMDQEEEILRAATLHLITKHGMFLVATGLREASVKGIRIWIITVALRYTTGHEGYIGDLLYDGEEFTFLTPPEIRKERARQIAADPERTTKWNEYRASAVQAGEG